MQSPEKENKTGKGDLSGLVRDFFGLFTEFMTREGITIKTLRKFNVLEEQYNFNRTQTKFIKGYVKVPKYAVRNMYS